MTDPLGFEFRAQLAENIKRQKAKWARDAEERQRLMRPRKEVPSEPLRRYAGDNESARDHAERVAAPTSVEFHAQDSDLPDMMFEEGK